jgi:hypothetical protein
MDAKLERRERTGKESQKLRKKLAELHTFFLLHDLCARNHIPTGATCRDVYSSTRLAKLLSRDSPTRRGSRNRSMKAGAVECWLRCDPKHQTGAWPWGFHHHPFHELGSNFVSSSGGPPPQFARCTKSVRCSIIQMLPVAQTNSGREIS